MSRKYSNKNKILIAKILGFCLLIAVGVYACNSPGNPENGPGLELDLTILAPNKRFEVCQEERETGILWCTYVWKTPDEYL